MVMASTNKKLGVALVGVGGMGRRWLSAVQNTSAVALRFVCDKDIESAQKIAGGISGCRASDDWERVADSPDIDVAIVALPHVLLAPVSSVFLKNKKHVLCEKPGGMVPQDIKRNIALAKRNNVRYMIGFNHRFHDGFQKMRKLFEEGAIGDIMFIRARYGFGGRVGYEKEWRFKKEISGGGELIDQGVHMIDMARWFLADVSEAKGFTSDAFWHGGAEDNAFVILWWRVWRKNMWERNGLLWENERVILRQKNRVLPVTPMRRNPWRNNCASSQAPSKKTVSQILREAMGLRY